ncbi:MAG: folylpolyglutamate synthase/dihydrofolate synthase family protein [Anaerolineaceae bacterium]|jgi:dihydrofolate synthase/folylpolyglutamate synthase
MADTYQEALDYLYSFVDYSLTRNLRYSADKFDLTRMADLLDRLGSPHRQYPVFHVAGTKGKGSTSAFIASGLEAAGYKVGFYISPHLHDFTERIQINRRLISHEVLSGLVEQVKPHVTQVPRLTTFEITTAIAFLYFAQQKVDVAVVEVGLGGRLDATNVVTPLVSVITSLSYDHMNVLGNTLEQIATEKGGIIKPAHPIVLAPQKDEARRVIEAIAAERQSPLIEVGRDISFEPIDHSLEGQNFKIVPTTGEFSRHLKETQLHIPLLGFHQLENATTAYAALQVANQRHGITTTDEQIAKGFAQVSWPGRFELLRKEPPIVVDGAHNGDSALKLKKAINDYFPGRDVIMVFGVSEDKDIKSMFAELLPAVKVLFVTQSVHPRAMEAEKLAELAKGYPCEVKVVKAIEDAFDQALKFSNSHSVVVVTGSIFVVAAARETWDRERETKKPAIPVVR